jgi:hypothetical protein
VPRVPSLLYSSLSSLPKILKNKIKKEGRKNKNKPEQIYGGGLDSQ